MPKCYITLLTPDGMYSAPYTAESLADAVQYEPKGVYTLTNTFNTFQVLKLDSHLDRMEDSARREGMTLRLDRPRLRAALRQMIAEAAMGNVRFRITVPYQQPDHLYLSIEQFVPPPAALYEHGARCVTVAGMARRNPEAKTNDWAQQRRSFTFPPGIHEALLVSHEGEILEGFSSNFYGILDGELRTAGEGILPGVAQQIVFEVAARSIPIRAQAVQVAALRALEEAFISSSSRGVMPVVEIDGITIGSGAPGPRTLAIRHDYLQWLNAHLEEL